MRTQTVAAGIALSAMCLSACGSASDASSRASTRRTANADSPARVLEILNEAGLCAEPQSEKAQPDSETSFGHPAMTVCHDPQAPAQETIVLMEGMRPLARDRMAAQLTDEHVFAYVRRDDDHWFLLVPEAQNEGTQAALGSQLRPLMIAPR